MSFLQRFVPTHTLCLLLSLLFAMTTSAQSLDCPAGGTCFPSDYANALCDGVCTLTAANAIECDLAQTGVSFPTVFVVSDVAGAGTETYSIYGEVKLVPFGCYVDASGPQTQVDRIIIRGSAFADTISLQDPPLSLESSGSLLVAEVRGGDADDTITGPYAGASQLRVELYGEADNDTISCGETSDDNCFVNGGPDDDVIFGSRNNDELRGGMGTDWISGDGGNDAIWGGGGCDFLYDNEKFPDGTPITTPHTPDGGDTIKGGDGDDFIVLGGPNGLATGGEGHDYLHGHGTDGVTLKGGDGIDSIQGSPGSDTLRGGLGSDVIKGGGGDDVFNGNSGSDHICAGIGAVEIKSHGDGEIDHIWVPPGASTAPIANTGSEDQCGDPSYNLGDCQHNVTALPGYLPWFCDSTMPRPTCTIPGID